MHFIGQLENNANFYCEIVPHLFKNCKLIINVKNQSIKISLFCFYIWKSIIQCNALERFQNIIFTYTSKFRENKS